MNHRCVSTMTYRKKETIKHCTKNCSSNGICNSLNNCHCFDGWAPPYCDRKGFGGSLDSGPPFDYVIRQNPSPPGYIIMTIGITTGTLVILVVAWKSFRLVKESCDKRKSKLNDSELKVLLQK